ncbi:enoyl-CoA hydratase/carnithine racemase [Saccharomonospora amisosensis]|uniref:Enoyl-CoA hydratase/carnithine racemase n=2 Tax=Saccharomonospora TaxID=1851 RepID=H5X737_9PSEU|nr:MULTISPECIES: enoyl-CoA hydratase-related protein [Saccharomonospora]EHR53505.1 enoyl-CoA hydratase/carnithine racemase [Saccharomonospora marina XMU15]NIJ09714.1 enoyl-CoA hydratase/carnithine racemase [Saccharomonospora amisosensis]
MTAQALAYEIVNEVVWITINRPEARNALNSEVRSALFEAFDTFNADRNAKVLVLTGAGDTAFCAGGDLKEMADTELTVPPSGFVPHLGRNVKVDKPTIAAVNGVAYAGGFLLAQMCDLVVAAEHARFAVTEVKVGRGAPWAAPLPWLIPPRVALQILLTGEPIDAARAYQIGLVNEVVPAGELREATQLFAERIAANAPLSVLAAKATIYAAADRGWHDALDEADRIWEPVYLSEDAQEGPRAFREKRKPVWRGR